VYDLLLAQQGDTEDTWKILQQMHPSLAVLSSSSVPPSVTIDDCDDDVNVDDDDILSLPPLPFTSPGSSTVPPSENGYSTLAHPAVRVCALAARDIYFSTTGTCTGTTSDDDGDDDCIWHPPVPSSVSSCSGEEIKWRHISSGQWCDHY
jgi:hypothetical protein